MIGELAAAELSHADDGEAARRRREPIARQRLALGDPERRRDAHVGEVAQLAAEGRERQEAHEIVDADAEELLVAEAAQHIELILVCLSGVRASSRARPPCPL